MALTHYKADIFKQSSNAGDGEAFMQNTMHHFMGYLDSNIFVTSQ